MGHLTTMQLLPTIIIVALLSFFLILTITLFIWHWNRTRRQLADSHHRALPGKPPRRLTLRDGKAIPSNLAHDTASTRQRYSLDLESLDVEKDFDFDAERGFTKPRRQKASKRSSRHSLKSLRRDRGQSWTPGRPPWLQKSPDLKDRHSKSVAEVKEPRRHSKPRDRSRSIPRPSLINIERRGSSQTRQSSEPQPPPPPRQSGGRRASTQTHISSEALQKRRAMGISESLYNAYKGHTPWTGEVHDPPNQMMVMPGPARTIASSTRDSTAHRWSLPATSSLHSSIPVTASFVGSSRAVSEPESIQPPPPLFHRRESGPHLSLASTQDANRKSFLTMTESPTSSTSTERAFLGPKDGIPPVPPLPDLSKTDPSALATAKEIPEYNEQSRPRKLDSDPSPDPLDVVERVRAFGRQRRQQVKSEFEEPVSPLQPSPSAPSKPASAYLHNVYPFPEVPRSNETSRRQRPRTTIPHGPPMASNTSAPRERPRTTLPRQASHSSRIEGAHDIALGNEIPAGFDFDAERAFGQMPEVRQRKSRLGSKRPPSIEVDIPHVERGSLSFLDHPTPTSHPTPSTPGHPLRRGPSVMSDRSQMTIASSEISSNWTIGKAELVNIYPSLADDDDMGTAESSRNSIRESDRRTPPYAKMLRSKFGQYPKGRRDKALPTLPKSPLSQFPPGF